MAAGARSEAGTRHRLPPELAASRIDRLIARPSPSFAMSNVQIAELAIKQRLPTMFTLRHYVEAGGLMSYGPDFNAMMRRRVRESIGTTRPEMARQNQDTTEALPPMRRRALPQTARH
jgi:hypothetical protein